MLHGAGARLSDVIERLKCGEETHPSRLGSVNEKKQPGLKDRAASNILETLKPTSASRLA